MCEIEKILGLTVSTASRNLRDLEAAGWLTSRREGRWMHYRVAELNPAWEAIRHSILDVFMHSAQAKNDLQRRDELLPAERRTMCAETATSLEALYEQIDTSTK